MRIFYFIIVAVLLSATIKTSYAQSSYNKNIWYSCKADSNCTLTEGLCGEAISINKKYQKQYNDWQSKIILDLECNQYTITNFDNFKPVCNKFKCSATKK